MREKVEMIQKLIEKLSRMLLIREVHFSIREAKRFSKETICAIYMPQLNVILLNRDWLDEADVLEINYIVAHEMRHVYQFLLTMNHPNYFDIPERVIQNWRLEFENYTMPNNSHNSDYEDQHVEIDADEYAMEFCKSSNSLI